MMVCFAVSILPVHIDWCLEHQHVAYERHSTVKLLAVKALMYIIKLLMAFIVHAGDATYAASLATAAQVVVRPCGAACSGYDHACAFRLNGTLECFGSNQYGAINVPAQNVGFTGVSCGGYATCVIRSDTTLECWGTLFSQSGPIPVNKNFPQPATGFADVSVGGGHVCAIRYNSSLECWGDNSFGQLDIPAPATGFVAVAAGFTQSCGIKYDTTLVCWGGNYANNDGEAVVPLPLTGYVAVAAGTQHTCAIRSDTTLICFGNAPGFAYPSQPETGIIAVSCGDCQTAALRVNTSLLYTAIDDAQGNQPKAYDIPPPNSGFAGVYAGDAQTCAIKSDSSFECWGNAFYGDSDVYNQLKDVQPLPGFGAPCLFQ